jgi:hypothetical protein
VGLRSFDLSALSDRGSDERPPAPERAADLADLRVDRLARDGLRDGVDIDRWSDEGGSVSTLGLQALLRGSE